MASARMSPTANLLRKSRLFALPPTLKAPSDAQSSRAAFESNSATLPHPIRASIVTPQSSLARGDWGLKRPLPAKSTSEKSNRPVVRVHALDTYEHVTDFESAADHTMTLEKFQEMHIPLSLPTKVNYATGVTPQHQSPFETHLDNTENSQGLDEAGAKQFRHTGPWLAGQNEAEFSAYLKQVTKNKPEIMRKLREQFVSKRTAELRKVAQDNGEDLEAVPSTVTDAEFNTYIKTLRHDPFALGPVVYDVLDLASPPAVPNERIGRKYYQASGTKLSSSDYAVTGPPKTHPSAGLNYTRSHALIKNHPKFGPQAYQRPVEARILRPKGRFKGRMARALAGVGGIVVEDLNSMTFYEQGAPAGLTYFDAAIPGGGKYWVNPIRAGVDSEGRISLSSYRASATAKAPYGIEDYIKPPTTKISNAATSSSPIVPRLDRQSFGQPRFQPSTGNRTPSHPTRGTEDVARSLLNNLNAKS
ncbi:Mitochondrial ribosomal protein MRP51 [Penicillium sp. DV-2018c]|nr:Mitochondrial ribosomal protein MRP51 [Penicillium sp. DV-2018c]KAJ5571072.1 Mitochondrial ribosomal protein MRP51 [Penicillium sp. DV-2018c]